MLEGGGQVPVLAAEQGHTAYTCVYVVPNIVLQQHLKEASSAVELVKFSCATCKVQLWNLSSSVVELVKFSCATCKV